LTQESLIVKIPAARLVRSAQAVDTRIQLNENIQR